ncbi:hypothetical protein L1987_10362 [Smallanthus sonchifolius]|uniref:Uncharacterized protein n=1 Tax=Smallanthus sonchifolius TaxID=185202 RepID=A0ACB9JRW4_9ASTR|nr:hypothetical protein L1987_10362 [Smallanthus sonchifolius]
MSYSGYYNPSPSAPPLPEPQSQPDHTYNYGEYQPMPSFPPGTRLEVIQSFQMVDLDRSGFIDTKELQQALSPKEFAELWSCLGQWRAIFERFDRDRSGKIDASELRDALYSLGFAIPPSVLQLLVWNDCDEKFKEKDTGYTGSASLSYETFMTMVTPFLAIE